MIVCVSVNPAIDRCIVLKWLELGQVNRADSAQSTPGGKAANVALGARALGAQVRYIGLLGGATGAEVAASLATHGVQVEAVPTAEPTRINLELIHEGGVTEVLEPGGSPSAAELDALRARCQSVFAACASGSVVAFSGSLPPGVHVGFYAELLQLAKAHGLRTILDTSGAWLARGLAGKPDFVKPNCEEAEAVLQRTIATPADAKAAAEELVARGAGAGIVSLGAAGLVGTSRRQAILVVPPRVDAGSAVGSGDVTVGGLAVALERGDSWSDQLAFAAACGAANCLAASPSSLSPATVAELRSQVTITQLG